MIFSISTVNIQHHQAAAGAAGPSSWVSLSERVISDESREETWTKDFHQKKSTRFYFYLFSTTSHTPLPDILYNASYVDPLHARLQWLL